MTTQLNLFDPTPPAAPVRPRKRIQLELVWNAPATPPEPATARPGVWTVEDSRASRAALEAGLERLAAIEAGEIPAPKQRKPTMDQRFGHWEPACIAERYRKAEGQVLTPRQIATRKAKAAVAKANDKRVDEYLNDLWRMTSAQVDQKWGKNENKHPQLSLCKAQQQLDAHTEAMRFIRWADRLPAKRRGIRKARRARK